MMAMPFRLGAFVVQHLARVREFQASHRRHKPLGWAITLEAVKRQPTKTNKPQQPESTCKPKLLEIWLEGGTFEVCSINPSSARSPSLNR